MGLGLMILFISGCKPNVAEPEFPAAASTVVDTPTSWTQEKLIGLANAEGFEFSPDVDPGLGWHATGNSQGNRVVSIGGHISMYIAQDRNGFLLSRSYSEFDELAQIISIADCARKSEEVLDRLATSEQFVTVSQHVQSYVNTFSFDYTRPHWSVAFGVKTVQVPSHKGYPVRDIENYRSVTVAVNNHVTTIRQSNKKVDRHYENENERHVDRQLAERLIIEGNKWGWEYLSDHKYRGLVWCKFKDDTKYRLRHYFEYIFDDKVDCATEIYNYYVDTEFGQVFLPQTLGDFLSSSSGSFGGFASLPAP